MIKHLSDKQFETLTKVVAEVVSPSVILVELLMRTGIRLEELIRIDVADIDYESRVIHVKRPAKGSAQRSIPVSLDFASRLNAMVTSQCLTPDDKLIKMLGSNGNDKAVKMAVRRVFKRLLNKVEYGLGHRHGPHCLRHTFALKIMGADGDVRLTQRLLGHRSMGSTFIYIDYLDDKSKADLVRKAIG